MVSERPPGAQAVQGQGPGAARPHCVDSQEVGRSGRIREGCRAGLGLARTLDSSAELLSPWDVLGWYLDELGPLAGLEGAGLAPGGVRRVGGGEDWPVVFRLTLQSQLYVFTTD